MKEKRPLKKRDIVSTVFFVSIALLVIIKLSSLFEGDTKSFYSLSDSVFSNEVGTFRYVLDVRTSEHTDSLNSKDISLDKLDYLDSSDSESDTSVEDNNSKIEDWTSTNTVQDICWKYPSYKVVIEGKTESTKPLKAMLNIKVTTDYTSADLTSLVFINDKVYIDLGTLRAWLLNAKDKNLVDLASTVPDNSKYLVLSGSDFDSVSLFNDLSKCSNSGDMTNLYRKFIVLEKIINNNLDKATPNSCKSKDDNKYNISISGNNSVTFISNLTKSLNNFGLYYDKYVSSLSKNKLITSKDKETLANEKYNYMNMMTDCITGLNCLTDAERKSLILKGSALEYKDSNGGKCYETSLIMGYTKNNTDFIVSFNGYKHPVSSTTDTVKEPSGAFYTKNDIKVDLSKSIYDLIEYFNISGISLGKSSSISIENIPTIILREFKDSVNIINSKYKDFTPLTDKTVIDFINTYSELSESESNSELVNSNIKLVKQFNSTQNKSKGVSEESSSEVTTSSNEVEKYPEIKATNDKFRISAKVNTDKTTDKLVVMDVTILNTSGEQLDLDLTKFKLIDVNGNKTSCNYSTKLHEYDNKFDLSLAPESVSINKNCFSDFKLYVVVNQLEGFNLYWKTNNLGVICNN